MGFWHNPVKEAGGWEAMAAQGMTDEEISKMEKEGYDMSPVRAKKTELATQDQAEEEAFAIQRKATAVPTDLNRLTPLPFNPPQYGK